MPRGGGERGDAEGKHGEVAVGGTSLIVDVPGWFPLWENEGGDAEGASDAFYGDVELVLSVCAPRRVLDGCCFGCGVCGGVAFGMCEENGIVGDGAGANVSCGFGD